MKNLWFDFTNPPHVNFFLPLIKYFQQKGFSTSLTAREFVETVKLLELNNLEFQLVGKHGGKNKFSKVSQLVKRKIQLFGKVSFDYSFSSNYDAPFVSWFKRKPALVFDDNDISPNWLYSYFAKYVISPSSIDVNAMYKMGVKKDQLITYNGFKENIYVADYIPDKTFLKNLPFKEFVTVRPENIKASYVPPGVKSIVPELINKLTNKGFNILYLPRYKEDNHYIKDNSKVFIPEKPLNGLDVCYYSLAVLTGAGTFSREAAVMSTPAVSFFAGNKFLGVDKKMFNEEMVFYSRDPDEIVNYVIKSGKKPFDNSNSKRIQSEFFELIEKILTNGLHPNHI